MIEVQIPTNIKELDEIIAKELNETWYAFKIMEHVERISLLILVLGILFKVC